VFAVRRAHRLARNIRDNQVERSTPKRRRRPSSRRLFKQQTLNRLPLSGEGVADSDEPDGIDVPIARPPTDAGRRAAITRVSAGYPGEHLARALLLSQCGVPRLLLERLRQLHETSAITRGGIERGQGTTASDVREREFHQACHLAIACTSNPDDRSMGHSVDFARVSP
jgi:hypothetical protein